MPFSLSIVSSGAQFDLGYGQVRPKSRRNNHTFDEINRWKWKVSLMSFLYFLKLVCSKCSSSNNLFDTHSKRILYWEFWPSHKALLFLFSAQKGIHVMVSLSSVSWLVKSREIPWMCCFCHAGPDLLQNRLFTKGFMLQMVTSGKMSVLFVMYS